jgi:hypothetical protein
MQQRKFDSCFDEGLLAHLAIQPLQQYAAATPAKPLRLLVRKRRISRNELARIVNDFLADPTLN